MCGEINKLIIRSSTSEYDLELKRKEKEILWIEINRDEFARIT